MDGDGNITTTPHPPIQTEASNRAGATAATGAVDQQPHH